MKMLFSLSFLHLLPLCRSSSEFEDYYATNDEAKLQYYLDTSPLDYISGSVYQPIGATERLDSKTIGDEFWADYQTETAPYYSCIDIDKNTGCSQCPVDDFLTTLQTTGMSNEQSVDATSFCDLAGMNVDVIFDEENPEPQAEVREVNDEPQAEDHEVNPQPQVERHVENPDVAAPQTAELPSWLVTEQGVNLNSLLFGDVQYERAINVTSLLFGHHYIPPIPVPVPTFGHNQVGSQPTPSTFMPASVNNEGRKRNVQDVNEATNSEPKNKTRKRKIEDVDGEVNSKVDKKKTRSVVVRQAWRQTYSLKMDKIMLAIRTAFAKYGIDFPANASKKAVLGAFNLIYGLKDTDAILAPLRTAAKPTVLTNPIPHKGYDYFVNRLFDYLVPTLLGNISKELFAESLDRLLSTLILRTGVNMAEWHINNPSR